MCHKTKMIEYTTGCSRKKRTKFLHTINFELFARESRCLYENVRQRLLSANQYKTNLCKLVKYNWKCLHVVMSPGCKHGTSHWLLNFTNWKRLQCWQNDCWVSVQLGGIILYLGCSSAHDVSSEHDYLNSEASPEQLPGHDQPRTNRRCYWPVV